MNMKKTLLGTATLAVVLGMLPGAAATVATDDAVTRTFDVEVIAQIDMKETNAGSGTGIYAPGAPCPLAIFGVRALVPSVIYYQDDRETFNLKTGELTLFPGQEIPLGGQTCPIPGSGPGQPLTIAVAPTNFFGPYNGVAIDQLICLQGNRDTGNTDISCFPDPDDSRAVIALCNVNDSFFIPSTGDKLTTKSVFGGMLGSHAIDCADDPLIPDDGLKNAIEYYNGGPSAPGRYCQDWFFDDGNWGTAFCVIQVEDIVPLGNGGPDKEDGGNDTGYIVTCMETNALVVDLSKTPSSWRQRFRSHDYKLVLDLDALGVQIDDSTIPPTITVRGVDNWIDAKLRHWGGNPPLQGWHDLSGKNGFPCPYGEPPIDKKDKTNDFGEVLNRIGCPDPVTGIPQGCDKK